MKDGRRIKMKNRECMSMNGMLGKCNVMFKETKTVNNSQPKS